MPRRANHTIATPNGLKCDHESESGDGVSAMIMLMTRDNDTRTVEDALSGDDWKDWERAVKEELPSIERNKTCELTDLSVGRNPLKNRWVFRTELKPSGPSCYKARLVANGYSQKQIIYYTET